jgi:predicted amidohydrolase YtcJ
MKHTSLIMLFAFPLFSLVGCQAAQQRAPADLVLTNAYIYTVDESRNIAEALAVRGNEIVFVGSSDAAAEYIGENTDVRDLNGAMVMPGIHDMHIHALGTVEPDACDLRSVAVTLEEMVPLLQACIARYELKAGDWLVVQQWAFAGGNQPSEDLPNIRAALDAVSTEHPIFLRGNDGHHAAANSAALATVKNESGETVGISAATLASDFADYLPMIAVDVAGEPTGGINEDARRLLRSGPSADSIDIGKWMPKVAARMAQSGITSLQDASVSPEALEMYAWLEENEQATFRLRAAMAEPRSENIDDIDAHLDALKVLREKYRDYTYVQADAVKLFADSVLEGNPLSGPPTMPVAALLEKYK